MDAAIIELDALADPVRSATEDDNLAAAAWFRLATSAGVTICDGDVGTSGATLNLNTTSIVTGGPISITSFTFTQG